MVFEEKRWEAEAESDSGYRCYRHGLGHERASAESAIEHDGAYCVWVYTDGSGCGENCGDQLCAEGSELRGFEEWRREQQLSILNPICKCTTLLSPSTCGPCLLGFLSPRSWLILFRTASLRFRVPLHGRYRTGNGHSL